MTRIAIVDDNQPTQDLLHDVFDQKGWESVSCTSGRGAFEIIKKEHPDLVILDLWLDPPITGWQVLEQLAEDSSTSRTPVILCSWDADSLRHDQDQSNGQVVAFLVKPFDIEHVYRCIEYALSASEVRP